MEKKIYGYYHIWLVHHWQEIVTEQIDTLVKSGLYDACENIYCGVLGENAEVKKLFKILDEYPKFIVSEISTNPELYEFQTIQIWKEHADKSTEDYYLFYFHVKGVSYPLEKNELAYHGGRYWRRFMDYWTLTQWRENVSELNKGYETCGTQMRVRDWPRHYSGSYFWARSEYVKVLRQVAELDLTNRMSAEFHILSGHPIAATLSQEFVDYYTPKQEGLDYSSIAIKPSKNGRNVVHTLSWNVPSETAEAVKQLYELNDRSDFQHVICDLGFPLRYPDQIPENIEETKKENSAILQDIARKYGSGLIKMKNVGVSQNWSQVAKAMKIDDGDVLVCCDPDERVDKAAVGWVRAMGEVMRKDDKYGAVCLVMEEQIPNLNPANIERKFVGSHRVIDVRGDAMWATASISGKFIKQMGGVPYPVKHPIYGGLETATRMAMDKLGYKWCFLEDYKVVHPDWDFSHYLRQWKHFCLEEGNEKVGFEEFLTRKKVEATA